MPIPTCPSCEIAMEVQTFEDVMFDICPSCRGVWLDRGEMQKVIAHVRRQEADAPGGFIDPRRAGQGAEPGRGSHEVPRSKRDEPHRGALYRDEGDRDDSRWVRDRGKPDRERRKRGLWDMIEDILD